MHRNRSASVHQFSMVPRADIPRSSFRMEHSHKTTFNSGYLVPIYCEEVLPGDSFNLKATMFARLATPIVPIVDNLYLESFFFFVPNRLIWSNWKKFCGERNSPADSIDYSVPQVVSPAGGFPQGSLYDYFGIPCAGQITAGQTISVNAMPFRAYKLIYQEWFRDENLTNSTIPTMSDGPDADTYVMYRRGKRHDYFTSCLPWVQKGDSVTLPLGSSATVKTSSTQLVSGTTNNALYFSQVNTGTRVTDDGNLGVNGQGALGRDSNGLSVAQTLYPDNLYADLSTATAATINQIRQAFQIQKLLERDARGGTRYIEVLKSHFGVISPDARLQRPEYLGGGMTPINISPIAQTQRTDEAATPLGTLGAIGTAVAHHGFTQSFTEHGYVIGLISVRADLTYQQGLRRHWSRKTRYDYYWPVFAMLGEQAVLNKEIYATGTSTDDQVFGYQERWAEYRHHPSVITNKLRSTATQPLDIWHLAQKFTTLPTLNSTFIQETPPVARIIATTEQTGDEFILDSLFVNKAARPLPMYSVPGLVDHF